VPPQNAQKIDLNAEYPCPCRRRGRLLPITLTEALGCDRCQRIFVVDEKGQSIEELSTTYPYKRAWRWTGYRWITARQSIGYGYLRLVTGIFMLLGVISLLLALHSSNLVFVAVLGLVVIMMLILIVWLAYRP
jgi:hypothetical protein